TSERSYVMRVSEIMTRGVECARPTDDLTRAAARMKKLNVGSLPVCGDSDKLVGMITDRDITIRGTAEALPPRLGQVQDVMTRDVNTASRIRTPARRPSSWRRTKSADSSSSTATSGWSASSRWAI